MTKFTAQIIISAVFSESQMIPKTFDFVVHVNQYIILQYTVSLVIAIVRT